MTLDEAMAEAREAAMEQLRRSEQRFIESNVELGTLTRQDAEAAVASFRGISMEAIEKRLDEIREEIRAEFMGTKH